MIPYEDGIFALEWLRGAFGFRENGARLTAPDGTLSHGKMKAGDGLIMIASSTPDYRCPKRHRESCEQARKWSTVPWIVDGVLVYVNDLERHFTRAKAARATILSDIEEGPPGRRYRAEDCEGHRWFFSRRAEYCCSQLRFTYSGEACAANPVESVLPSSSVAGIDLNFYEAGYYRRICLQQF